MKLLGIISVGFNVTAQPYFCIRQILEKKSEYSETVHQLFVAFKKADDSVRREEFYNTRIEFGVLVKVVRLIKSCLNETIVYVYVNTSLLHFVFRMT
jgi:hypothetical protein